MLCDYEKFLVRNVLRVVRIRFEGSLGYEQGSVMMDA